MPVTYSGRNVTEGNTTHPSLIDLAVGMSRQPRWSGQSRRWFSVLDHTLFGDDLIRHEASAHVRLAWLLHDAHEALTGDVPTPFKGAELRSIQASLDRRIAAAFMPGGVPTWAQCREEVKRTDRRTLLAESTLVGPPDSSMMQVMLPLSDTDDDPVRREADRDILRRALGRGEYLGIPPVTYPSTPDQHAGVQEFLSRMMELL